MGTRKSAQDTSEPKGLQRHLFCLLSSEAGSREQGTILSKEAELTGVSFAGLVLSLPVKDPDGAEDTIVAGNNLYLSPPYLHDPIRYPGRGEPLKLFLRRF